MAASMLKKTKESSRLVIRSYDGINDLIDSTDRPRPSVPDFEYNSLVA